jgi:hypothetical protein
MKRIKIFKRKKPVLSGGIFDGSSIEGAQGTSGMGDMDVTYSGTSGIESPRIVWDNRKK